jgi:cell division septation protein DedD
MVVFAGGLWLAYVQGARHGSAPQTSATGENVPLIRADQRPIKVKPDQPGGMEVPDLDKLVFSEKSGGPPVERLLPPPERPEPLPPSVPKQALMAPPPVPTVPTGASPVINTAPASDAPAQSKAATAKPSPTKAPAAAKPTAATSVTPVAATAGGVRVQLGSLRSPEAARDEWQRLKRINADLLGKLTAVAVRAEVPEKGTYYRVEAGPLADGAAASQLCGELKKRNLGCTIVR